MSVTLAQLKEDVRQEYNLPEFTTSGFVTIEAVERLINQAAKMYYGVLIDCYGDGYFGTSTTITTVAGVDLSSLPSDFVKLRKLFWIRGTDDVVPVLPASPDETYLSGYGSESWTTYPPKYTLESHVLRWFPTPSAAYTLTLDYAYIPEDLVQDTDTVDCGLSHELFIVNEVCRRIAIREEKDPSLFIRERDYWDREIRSKASERNESELQILRGVARVNTQESAWARRDRLSRL